MGLRFWSQSFVRIHDDVRVGFVSFLIVSALIVFIVALTSKLSITALAFSSYDFDYFPMAVTAYAKLYVAIAIPACASVSAFTISLT